MKVIKNIYLYNRLVKGSHKRLMILANKTLPYDYNKHTQYIEAIIGNRLYKFNRKVSTGNLYLIAVLELEDCKSWQDVKSNAAKLLVSNPAYLNCLMRINDLA